MTETGSGIVVRETGEIKEIGEAPLVTLSETSIANIAHNVVMAEKLVTTLLEKDIDYGRTPGTPIDGLWDAGAAKIMAGFNCYVDHEVLFHTDQDNLISWCIQAKIISRASQTVVGTGVGAASTKETKYKYRWVPHPKDFGYGDDEIAKMKRRGNTYRIINPEYGELVNTLFLMAAKRAEVDGARSMPGVGGALKKLFENKLKGQPRQTGSRKLDYPGYWAKIKQMGLTEEQHYEYLGRASLNSWIDNGGTLETALLKVVASAAKSKTAGARQSEEPAAPRVGKERTEDELKTTLDLLRICDEDFGMSSTEVFNELNYPNQLAYDEAKVERPFASYISIKAAKEGPAEEVEPEDIPF